MGVPRDSGRTCRVAPVRTAHMIQQQHRKWMGALAPPVLIAAVAGWMWLDSHNYPSVPRSPSAPQSPISAAMARASDDDVAGAETTAALAMTSETGSESAASLRRISIFRQSFQRGGLGSKALMTFTIRNRNDYAVKDLEVLCAFRGRDGLVLTERRRTIADTVEPKSRKAFPLTHIGHIKLTAARARCRLLAAARI
jgi:hypothetical protein